MEIIFNGVPENISAPVLYEFLTVKNLAGKTGIAIAVNQQVIRKDEWQNYILKDKDSVLAIRASQGG